LGRRVQKIRKRRSKAGEGGEDEYGIFRLVPRREVKVEGLLAQKDVGGIYHLRVPPDDLPGGLRVKRPGRSLVLHGSRRGVACPTWQERERTRQRRLKNRGILFGTSVGSHRRDCPPPP